MKKTMGSISIRTFDALTDDHRGRFSFRTVGPYQVMRCAALRSVMMVVHAEELERHGDRFGIVAEPLRTRSIRPCRHAFQFRRIVDEYSVLGSTALLLTEDVVLTAAHALASPRGGTPTNLTDVRFVFRDLAEGATEPPSVRPAHVLEPLELLAKENEEGDGARDWALVRVRRHEQGHRAAVRTRRLRIADVPRPRERVWYAGHPGGVQLKTESGVVLSDIASEGVFRASVDVISGASGSPFFDERGRIAGVLRGFPAGWLEQPRPNGQRCYVPMFTNETRQPVTALWRIHTWLRSNGDRKLAKLLEDFSAN